MNPTPQLIGDALDHMDTYYWSMNRVELTFTHEGDGVLRVEARDLDYTLLGSTLVRLEKVDQ